MAQAFLLTEAKKHAQAAVAQEREDGDPAKAADHYVRAVELLLCAANETKFESEQSRQYCLAEISTKVAEYLDRAHLLESVVSEEPAPAHQGHATAHYSTGAQEFGATQVSSDHEDDEGLTGAGYADADAAAFYDALPDIPPVSTSPRDDPADVHDLYGGQQHYSQSDARHAGAHQGGSGGEVGFGSGTTTGDQGGGAGGDHFDALMARYASAPSTGGRGA
jgi:hypothetical protein